MSAGSDAGEPVLLRRFDGLPWAGGPVEAWAGRQPPGGLPVSSASVLVLHGAELLLVDVRRRGWDLPGGHLEPGEDAAAALERELREEAGLTADGVTPPAVVGWFRLPDALMLVSVAQLRAGAGAPLVPGVPEEIREARLFPLAGLPPVCERRIWFPYLDVVAPGSVSSPDSTSGAPSAR